MRDKNKIVRKFINYASALGLTLILISPGIADAFSGYGSGIQSTPYMISTCSQLEAISNNLSAYYELASSIDCTGVSFTSINNFTGTLNGNNHTINNLNGNGFGLFESTDGATIENLNIINGSISNSSNDYIGVLDGITNSTTITNIHLEDMNITVPGALGYWGGIVGEMESGSTISNSSYSGGFTANSYSGGFAGDMSGGTISDSFFNGTFTTNGYYQGGFVGLFTGGTLNRVYISGSFVLSNNAYDGGLAGSVGGGTIDNSFDAATFSGTNDGHDNAITGTSSGSYSNDYFDEYLAGTASCGPSSGCTAENASNSTPAYFQDNSTNGPLNSWDFTSTWSVTGTYPTLQNIAAFTFPSGIPNNGDSTGDGKLDVYQANVADIKDANSNWTTLVVPSTTGCILGNGQPTPSNSVAADSGYSSLGSLISFNIYCPTVGMTAPVTIIYNTVYSKPVLLYYNPNSKTYVTVPGATFSTVTIGGVNKTEVTYDITDGSSLDEDGVANGVIVDPVELATATSSAASTPNTGYGKPGSNTSKYLIYSLAVSSIISIGTGLALSGKRHII